MRLINHRRSLLTRRFLVWPLALAAGAIWLGCGGQDDEDATPAAADNPVASSSARHGDGQPDRADRVEPQGGARHGDRTSQRENRPPKPHPKPASPDAQSRRSSDGSGSSQHQVDAGDNENESAEIEGEAVITDTAQAPPGKPDRGSKESVAVQSADIEGGSDDGAQHSSGESAAAAAAAN
jgi:hypothetical protein